MSKTIPLTVYLGAHDVERVSQMAEAHGISFPAAVKLAIAIAYRQHDALTCDPQTVRRADKRKREVKP